MNRKLIAILIIVIILGAGAAAIYFILWNRKKDHLELVETPSEFEASVIINEIKPSKSVDEEYIELSIIGNLPDLEGWIVTTYDNDQIVLPKIEGNGKNVFIRIYLGTGTNELNSSDNQVTIYAGLRAHVLGLSGDEVGLHDTTGKLIDFFRYGGGNGDKVMGSWKTNDGGPDIPKGDKSLSLIGSVDDKNSGASWMVGPMTPGEPNIAVFQTTGKYGGEELWITNGIRVTATDPGIDDVVLEGTEEGSSEPPYLSQGENVTVTAGPGVNNTVINYIREHANFSLNFYRAHNFTNPEKTNQSRIDVRVVQSNKSYSSGTCYPNGTIVIRVGRNCTKEELKVTCEHELMHAFQFKRDNDTNGFFRRIFNPDWWWDEGQAEFWGIWSMLRNYPNMTLESWMRMAQRLGSANWHDHYRDLNTTGAFRRWGGTWHCYIASFLFVKFINETFGLAVLLKVFNKTRYYGAGNPNNVDPKDAFAEVLNMTWSEIYGRFLKWLLLDAHNANGVPLYTPNIQLKYNGTEVSDTTGVRGWGGAVIEEVEIKNSTAFTIHLNNTWAVNNWTVVVLIFYEDGTNSSIEVPMNSTSRSGQIHINPDSPKKIARIWIVKSLTGRWAGRITMRVVPAKVVRFKYNNDTIGDTAEIQPKDRLYEEIIINGTQAFKINLNWNATNNGTHWRFKINRYWANGTVTTEIIEVVNGTWLEYFVDPDAGPVRLTKIVVVKENLIDTALNITMNTLPQTELTYKNNTLADIAVVQLGKKVYEIININGTQAFKINLNWTTTNNGTHWRFKIIHYWANGTITTETIELVNGTGPEYFVDPDAGPVKLTKIVIVKENLIGTTLKIRMRITPQKEFTYNNKTLGDTAEVQPGKKVYETININNTQPFIVFLNFTANTYWNITIIRYWDNGTIDKITVRANGTLGYFVKPAAGGAKIKTIVFVKENLNATTASVTMRLAPIPEWLENLLFPWAVNTSYYWTPTIERYTLYGGLIAGYAFLEGGTYELFLYFPEALFDIYVLNDELEVVFERIGIFEYYGDLLPLSLTGGLYYFVINFHSGEETGVIILYESYT